MELTLLNLGLIILLAAIFFVALYLVIRLAIDHSQLAADMQQVRALLAYGLSEDEEYEEEPLIPDEVLCPMCKKEVSPRAKKCPGCGLKFDKI